MESELGWLQAWYRAQCDGTWEHAYGVRIDSLDNPGWSVAIDLKGTSLERVPMATVLRDNGPDDWIRLDAKDGQFVGHGDSSKLAAILAAFREWALEAKRHGLSEPKSIG